jgi:hypothetical protein
VYVRASCIAVSQGHTQYAHRINPKLTNFAVGQRTRQHLCSQPERAHDSSHTHTYTHTRTCFASSRVGAMQMVLGVRPNFGAAQPGAFCSLSSRSTMGSVKPKVLPCPVRARPTTHLPVCVCACACVCVRVNMYEFVCVYVSVCERVCVVRE